MRSFTNKEGSRIVKEMIRVIQENKEYLSDVDGVIGDGDHGINMNKGFTMAEAELSNKEVNLTESFAILSMTLMNKIGGSMGPLYGSIFMGMQMAVADKENIDGSVLAQMLNNAYDNIKMISPAKPGDKTLVDVLDPAVTAYQETWEKSSDVLQALSACKEAAIMGMHATIDMCAKLGRASRLKEKSIGHQDAGATSCCLLISALCDAATALLK